MPSGKSLKAIATLFALLALSLTALPATAAEDVVNINDADSSELSLLPRVGPALASRILEFREENGKFKSPEDLMLVRGIGEKTLDLIRPFVTTSGKTTLASKVSVSRAEEAAAKPREPEKKEKAESKDGGR